MAGLGAGEAVRVSSTRISGERFVAYRCFNWMRPARIADGYLRASALLKLLQLYLFDLYLFWCSFVTHVLRCAKPVYYR
jgi:hypothetical protein